MPHPWPDQDLAALTRAFGLRDRDPLFLLDGVLAARLGRNARARPREAAAALLDDASALRAGSGVHAVLALPRDAPRPGPFATSAATGTAIWFAAPPEAPRPPAGLRTCRIGFRPSHLRIDWRTSLVARCSGAPGAIALHEGTTVVPTLFHDQDVLDAVLAAGFGTDVPAPGVDPSALMWSRHPVPLAALGELARDAGIRLLPLPPGAPLAILAVEDGGVAIAGDRPALAEGYRTGATVMACVGLSGGIDIRILSVPGGLVALASLGAPRATAGPNP